MLLTAKRSFLINQETVSHEAEARMMHLDNTEAESDTTNNRPLVTNIYVTTMAP